MWRMVAWKLLPAQNKYLLYKKNMYRKFVVLRKTWYYAENENTTS